MNISDAYDAALSGWLEAGLTIEQAKERIDATEDIQWQMLKALNAVMQAGFDCMTDEQFAAIDLVEAALKKAEDSAE